MKPTGTGTKFQILTGNRFGLPAFPPGLKKTVRWQSRKPLTECRSYVRITVLGRPQWEKCSTLLSFGMEGLCAEGMRRINLQNVRAERCGLTGRSRQGPSRRDEIHQLLSGKTERDALQQGNTIKTLLKPNYIDYLR